MTRSRILFLIASALVVVPLLTSGLGRALAADDQAGSDSRFKYLSVFTEVLQLVRQAYVEEPDLRVLMAGALSGATDALDPFSSYIPAEQVEDYLDNREVSRGVSGMAVLKDRGVAWVVALDEGGPADAAGLRRGDILSELADVSTRSMPMWRIHQILSQEPGTVVKVSAVRSSEDHGFEIVLGGDRPQPSFELGERRGYAYFRFPEVSEDALAALRRDLTEVGERTLLLDLRGAVGGDPEAAYAVAGLFRTGELGSLRGRDEVLDTYGNDVAASWNGDLVILQDRGTQGAAEIVSSVLKGSENVTVLGEPSFGHSGRLGTQRLSSGGMVEFTDAFYTGPDGEPLDEGIEPDLVVRRRFLADDDNDRDELFLEQALEVLEEARTGVDSQEEVA